MYGKLMQAAVNLDDLDSLPTIGEHDTEPADYPLGGPDTLWQQEEASGTRRKALVDDSEVIGIRSIVSYLQNEIAEAQAQLRTSSAERQQSLCREAELHIRAVEAERRADQAEQRARDAEQRARQAEARLRDLESSLDWALSNDLPTFDAAVV